MITARDVVRVGRTGQPLIHNGGRLTPDDLMRDTTRKDWFGMYFGLKAKAAERIAEEFNRVHPDLPDPGASRGVAKGTRPLAIPAQRARLALVAAS